MVLKNIHLLVANDFAAVNDCITAQLHTHVDLINQLSQHIIHSGGKRLRPLIVLLSANACGYQGNTHIAIAAIVEFIHTATLLHDDVVDHSKLRRGKKTANMIWGNEASVLVGDFLYSRAFQMMVSLQEKSLDAMRILADTTNAIAEGEVLQLLNCHQDTVTEKQYMRVIYNKTAKLFEAASELGAMLANRDIKEIQAMRDYGRYLGNAFQLIDDALDYCATSDDIGKNIGDDLAQGKPTLPLIYAFTQGNAAQKTMISDAIRNGSLEKLSEIIATIESTGAITYTYRAATQQAANAKETLSAIPDSPYRQALIKLAEFAVARSY